MDAQMPRRQDGEDRPTHNPSGSLAYTANRRGHKHAALKQTASCFRFALRRSVVRMSQLMDVPLPVDKITNCDWAPPGTAVKNAGSEFEQRQSRWPEERDTGMYFVTQSHLGARQCVHYKNDIA